MRFRSKQEIIHLLQEYEASKQHASLVKFCKDHGLPTATFYTWQKHRREGKYAIQGKFIELIMEPVPVATLPTPLNGTDNAPGIPGKALDMNINLNGINWFENVGKPLEAGIFNIPIKIINSKVECLKNNNALNWENFILYARNRLSWYIQSFHKEESKKWNEISAKARLDFKGYEPAIIDCAHRNDIHKDLLASLKSNIISYSIEKHYFDQLDKNVPKQFDLIMNMYRSGHVPCGWDGPLPKNEGYEQIDFNTGKLLVW